MGVAQQSLGAAVQRARDQAKALLNVLETQGHPQTHQSSALYLALVTIQKQLLGAGASSAPIAQFVPQLEQLVSQCEGKLAPVKPLIEDALRVAREVRAKT